MRNELKKSPTIVPLAEIDINSISEISENQKAVTRTMSKEKAEAEYSFSFDGSSAFINPPTGHYILPTWYRMSLDPNEEVCKQSLVVNRDGGNLIVIMATTDAGLFRIVVR